MKEVSRFKSCLSFSEYLLTKRWEEVHLWLFFVCVNYNTDVHTPGMRKTELQHQIMKLNTFLKSNDYIYMIK